MPVMWRRHARSGAKLGAQLTAGVLIAVLTLVWVLTQTDWGRERVRLYGVEQLARRIHGKVQIGEVHGDLLTGATLASSFCWGGKSICLPATSPPL